jgi:hypothetical protein
VRCWAPAPACHRNGRASVSLTGRRIHARVTRRLQVPAWWTTEDNRFHHVPGDDHAPSVVQELQPGLVDAVVVLRRQRVVFIAVRLEAVPGHWELIELLY